jgi:hypothetical protein
MSWVVPAHMAGGTHAKHERNRCCSSQLLESKWRIWATGEPLDIVKGTNTSAGVFRKMEKQSYSKAKGGVVLVTWK